MRVILARLILALAVCASFVQAQTITSKEPITGNLSGISTSSSDLLQVRFTLANCGTANPIVPGVTTIVPKTKIFTADANGNVSDTIWGNDAIACNLGFTTVYQVQFLRNNVPTGVVAQYRVIAPGPFNLSTAVPVSTLPPVNMPASGFQCPLNNTMVGLLPDWTPICGYVTGGSLDQTALHNNPTASQTVAQPTGTTFQASSLQNIINTDLANNATGTTDLRIKAADQAQPTGAFAQLEVNTPGTIAGAFTLRPNRILRIRQPITWSATVTASNNDYVMCDPGVVITTTLPTYFGSSVGVMLNGSGVTGIGFFGCTVVSSGAGFPVVLSGSTINSVDMANLNLNGVSAFANTAGGTGQRFTHISVSNETFNAPLLIFYSSAVTAIDFLCTNTIHCGQYWGGDSNGGSLQTINAFDITFSHFKCKGIIGACGWGSMGSGISILDGDCDGASDLCWDVEGTAHGLISGNRGANYTNACLGTFFFGADLTFSHNVCSTATGAAGGGIFEMKNASGDPRMYSEILWDSNRAFCGAVQCYWVRLESPGGSQFTNNQVLNGVSLRVGFEQDTYYKGNRFHFTVPMGSGSPILLGQCLYHSLCGAESNIIKSDVVQPAGTACIVVTTYDFNDIDSFPILRNHCGGLHPFPVDLSLANGNTNPSSPVVLDVRGNFFAANNIVTSTGLGYQTYLLGTDNTTANGAFMQSNIDQTASAVSGQTAATAGATVTVSVPYPLPFGTSRNDVCTVTAIAGDPYITGSTSTTQAVSITLTARTAVAATGRVTCRGTHTGS